MPAGTNNVTDMFPVLSFTLQERDQYCKKTWNITPRNNWIDVQMFGKSKSTSLTVFPLFHPVLSELSVDIVPFHNAHVQMWHYKTK